jgi:hypothetical protein
MVRGLKLFVCFIALGQVYAQSDYKVTNNVPVFKQWVVDFSDNSKLDVVAINAGVVAPPPFSNTKEIKAQLDAQRKRTFSEKNKVTHRSDIDPTVLTGFNGKPLGAAGIPNDNTLAVSNAGIVVSAINTSVNILDAEGKGLKFRTLSGIVAGQLGILDRFYDPKVLYDPINDRFILVFLEGSESSDTRIIVGFTQTNDPTGLWNFYAINGNPIGGAKWSDYPIIAHNKEDLYITVNILRDNESWQEGFVQSVIWQVNKNSGYTGGTLIQNMFSDIGFENKPVWSICPVQPALDMDQKGMYLLSVRPDASANDTVFLHEITNTAASGQANHILKVLKSTEKYGVPPSALQPKLGFKLQTNDTRVLSASLHLGEIQYVQSTLVASPLSSGIYHGTITNTATNPSVRGRVISTLGMDYAYPSLAFGGQTAEENSMIMTFSHVSESEFPGTSAIFYTFKDGVNDYYSDVKPIKLGDSVINTFLADSIERWGDYTDIQAQYNDLGAVWLCGSYGDVSGKNNVWIAKVRSNNVLLSIEEMFVYPNPSNEFMKIATIFKHNELVKISIIDNLGREVKSIDKQQVKPGNVEFLVDVSGITAGNYILTIASESGQKRVSQKVRIK